MYDIRGSHARARALPEPCPSHTGMNGFNRKTALIIHMCVVRSSFPNFRNTNVMFYEVWATAKTVVAKHCGFDSP